MKRWQYYRHSLVWLKSKLYLPIELQKHEQINTWIQRNQPFVVVRQDDIDEDIDEQRLKIAVSLSADKSPLSRVAFMVNKSDILSISQPLSWINIVDVLKILKIAEFTNNINELILNGLNPCVYGSYSWQIITGNGYTNQSSDLDLLLYISKSEQLNNIQSILVSMEQNSGVRNDGELIFAKDYAVAWREWYSDAKEILVKTINKVEFMSRERILRML